MELLQVQIGYRMSILNMLGFSLINQLVHCFNCVITFEYIPKAFLLVTVLPLHKGNGKPMSMHRWIPTVDFISLTSSEVSEIKSTVGIRR